MLVVVHRVTVEEKMQNEVVNVQVETIEVDPVKEQIVSLLKQGICDVTFTKVNGELRTMPCTLRADLLPESKQKDLTFETIRERKDNVLSVWCTDKAAWRSFRVENVIQVDPKVEDENLDSNT